MHPYFQTIPATVRKNLQNMAATLVVFLLLFCMKICFAEASVGRGKEYRVGGKVLLQPPPVTTFSCTLLNDYMICKMTVENVSVNEGAVISSEEKSDLKKCRYS